MNPAELWRQYIWNPVALYAYALYFFGSGKSWQEEEEREQKRNQQQYPTPPQDGVL